MKEKPTCALCGGPIAPTTQVGVCTRNETCKRENDRRKRARYLQQNKRPRVTVPPGTEEEKKRLAAARREREFIEARRKARGVPPEGLPPRDFRAERNAWLVPRGTEVNT
jgi:hypothetical protein